jgi:hypothetical protein
VSDNILYQSTVTIAGYGKTNTDLICNLIKTVELIIIPRQECEQRIINLKKNPCKIAEKYLCGIANPVAIMIAVCIISNKYY